MNPIAEEIQSYFGISKDDSLQHYGMPRRSGRYPWGSGENPYQSSMDFLGRVEKLKESGWEETPENIEKEFGMKTTRYRTEIRLAKEERKLHQIHTAKSLQKDGLNTSEIGRKMGVNESTVRGWLKEDSAARLNKSRATVDILKKRMAELPEGAMLDVGKDVERELGISRQNLDTALLMLEKEGYHTYSGSRMDQMGATNPNQKTTQKILCPPGYEHKDIYNLENIHTVKEYITRDGGKTFEKKFNYPASLDSKRLQIVYDEDGGTEKDGIIELRRGCDDLSLGNSRYSQVRILVDDTHFLKGMAVYSDDLPDGVDVRFNTNKKRGTPQEKVLKEIKKDPDNPFGSAIKDAEQGGQYWYIDKKTGEKKLGLINKRADEGDWSDWSDKLPSQFLSKQSTQLAKKQLDIAKNKRQDEFEDICELNNPTIKRHLLEEFANGCDSDAVNLKAASLPGQKYRVIIPINSLKDNECYCPAYEDGTQLALIRYPHAGTFEIPIVTVNNKHKGSRKVLDEDITDAIGINKKVADRLSGADFDGDTVMCIPTHGKNGVRIKSTKALKGLEDFDPKDKYGTEEVVDSDGTKRYFRNGREVRIMSEEYKGKQMGVISNLITDMTLDGGASPEEMAAAVRHSMVVIDAAKHKLDYKQSEIDNNIATLHEKYQGKRGGGAATIISRAKGQATVDKRQGSPHINLKDNPDYDPTKPEGALIYKTAEDRYLYRPITSTNSKGQKVIRTVDGKNIKYNPDDPGESDKYRPRQNIDKETGTVTWTDKSGKIQYAVEKRTQKSTKMAETDDAYTLVSESRHPMEMLYADYANSMKSMANQARLEMVNTGKLERNTSAAKTYANEVNSLKSKLNEARLNTPRERAAVRMANIEVNNKKKDGTISKDDRDAIRKAQTKAVAKYRDEVGSVSRKKRNIDITDREWEAIQAGAVSDSLLKDILNNTDIDKLRQRATPRTTTALSTSQISRAKSMANSGYTTAEIANKFGVSPTTISNYLKGAN